jgi:hypothetical protein
MYDPRIGRFTQNDPLRLKSPFQHYAYANNNPVSIVDPLGRDGELLEGFKLGWDLYKKAVDPLASIRKTIVRKAKEAYNNFINSIDTAGKPVTAFTTEAARGSLKLTEKVFDRLEGIHQTIANPLEALVGIVESKVALTKEVLDKGVGAVVVEHANDIIEEAQEDPSGFAMDRGLDLLEFALLTEVPGESPSTVREPRVRIRHYTNAKGLAGIEEEGVIKAGDRGRVFAEPANRTPEAPRDVEARYKIKQGRGRHYVETDVPESRVSRVKNPKTGNWELEIEGDVLLENEKIQKR